jgi:8-oxo-dGTP pyrophosphatase MutT (NUDIX family)
MQTGPVIALALEGVDAVAKVRKIIGPTFPDQAAPGTVRGDFAHQTKTSSEVLIVCRRSEDANGISWQFPAGVVKPGGRPAVVAVRETLAETDLHCVVTRKLGTRLHPTTGVLCEYVLCDYVAGEARNVDVVENVAAIWVDRADLTRFVPSAQVYGPVLRALDAAPNNTQ